MERSKVSAVTSLQSTVSNSHLTSACSHSLIHHDPTLLAPPVRSPPRHLTHFYPPVSSCTLNLFIHSCLWAFACILPLARNQGNLRSLPGQVLSGEPERGQSSQGHTASKRLSQALMSGQTPVRLHSEMLTTPPSSDLPSEPHTMGRISCGQLSVYHQSSIRTLNTPGHCR